MEIMSQSPESREVSMDSTMGKTYGSLKTESTVVSDRKQSMFNPTPQEVAFLLCPKRPVHQGQ